MTFDNLASGLVGALIGAAASTAWLAWERRQRHKAAGRAVLVELARDSVIVASLLDGLVGVDWPFSSSTYHAVLPELAGMLNLSELSTVSQPYLAMEAAEAIRASRGGWQGLTVDEREKLESHRRLLEAAREALAPHIR